MDLLLRHWYDQVNVYLYRIWKSKRAYASDEICQYFFQVICFWSLLSWSLYHLIPSILSSFTATEIITICPWSLHFYVPFFRQSSSIVWWFSLWSFWGVPTIPCVYDQIIHVSLQIVLAVLPLLLFCALISWNLNSFLESHVSYITIR